MNMLKLWAAKGNMKISPAQMEFEISKGRFTAYAPRVQLGRGGKETVVRPRPPWRARREEIEFASAVLRLVRLPRGMKMPDFFNDKLTMADANLFFSGIGLVILDMLPSIAEFQRQAFEAELCAWGTTYMRKFSKRNLRGQQQEMARALTLSEMALPMVCTCLSIRIDIRSHETDSRTSPATGRGVTVYFHLGMCACRRTLACQSTMDLKFTCPVKAT